VCGELRFDPPWHAGERQMFDNYQIDVKDQFAEWKARADDGRAKGSWRATFGMFADDADFDEVLRLGREYREEANQERE
jgi:hypothetical protein